MFRPIAPRLSKEALCEAYLARLAAAIADLQASGEGVAAMIVCSILANEGLPDIPSGFMGRAAAMVRDAGGLVIADEVQAGYARTGHWWGYEVTGFTPDIVVTGKPMGAGLPLAATAASRALVETFRSKTRYFNTFASSPLQAAVGMAGYQTRSSNATSSATSPLSAQRSRRRSRSARAPVMRSATCAVTACSSASSWSDPRTMRPTRSRQAGDQPAEGPGFPDQQCRRLRERREDPPAAAVLSSQCRRVPGRLGRNDRRPRGMTKEAELAYAPAARQALTAFGVEPADLRFVNLSENVTFRAIDARDGSPLVLRLHRPWYDDIVALRIGAPVDPCTGSGRHRGAGTAANAGGRELRPGRDRARPENGAGLASRAGWKASCSPMWSRANRHRCQRPTSLRAHRRDHGGDARPGDRLDTARRVPAACARRRRADGARTVLGAVLGPCPLSPADRTMLLGIRDRLHAALTRYGKPARTSRPDPC